MQEPYMLLDGSFYGSHSPAVFCERYFNELEEQGLGAKAREIIDADHATGVQWPEDYTEDVAALANLMEHATWGWEDILNDFRPEPEYCMSYLPNSEALYAVPIGFDWDEWDQEKWRPYNAE